MRVRTTVILAVVGLLAVGVYYVLEIRGREAREAARAAERRVLHFDIAQVREITVEKRDERVVVRGDGDRWRIVAPEDTAADAPTVEGLLAFVRRLEKVRSVDGAAADLRPFGLDDPVVRLRLRLREGDAVTLALAGPNPAVTGVYARVDGTPMVFLAPVELARELAKTPYVDELRDKTVLALEPERVRRLEIERADARIAVERVGARTWRVLRPFTGAGDDGIIRDLLWKVGSARAHRTIRGSGPPGEYGLDRPHARVRIHDDRGVRTLVLAQDGAKTGTLYVAVEGSGAVHAVDPQLLADVAIAPEALRHRQLLVYDERELERISIRYPNATLVLERAGDGWRVTGPGEGEALRPAVDNLLEVLPNFRYTTVAATAAADLRPYGLDRPQLALTVGLRGGRELPTLAVGREQGGLHFVMVGGAAPVYTVDARLVRVIPEDPADARRYPLPEQLKRGLDRLQRDKR